MEEEWTEVAVGSDGAIRRPSLSHPSLQSVDVVRSMSDHSPMTYDINSASMDMRSTSGIDEDRSRSINSSESVQQFRRPSFSHPISVDVVRSTSDHSPMTYDNLSTSMDMRSTSGVADSGTRTHDLNTGKWAALLNHYTKGYKFSMLLL